MARGARLVRAARHDGRDAAALPVAEGVAALMGIDQLRLDFFVQQGSTRFVINENSLSSARSPLFTYAFKYMSYLWAEGHVNKWWARIFFPPSSPARARVRVALARLLRPHMAGTRAPSPRRSARMS